MKKIAVIVTNTTKMGENGPQTGIHMAELTHALDLFDKNKIVYDIFSPQGGKVLLDSVDETDDINAEFLRNETKMMLLENTEKIGNANYEDYDAIYFPGGHGPMWDLGDNAEVKQFVANAYENGAVVGAVCHGVVGLLNVKLSNGDFLVEGKSINSFTDDEEREVGHDKRVPFLLESKLKEQGAHFNSSGLFEMHMESDERVVTGQNPASVEAVVEEMITLMKFKANSGI